MTLTILPLTEKTPLPHIESIIDFIWQEWGDLYKSLDSLKEEIKYCAQTNNASFILYAFLEKENKVCGCISLLENDLDEYAHLSPWLANFFIAPKYRVKGIGLNLYNALLKESFENLKYKTIYLYTANPSPYISKKWENIEQFEYQNKLQSLLKLTSNIYHKNNL